MVLKRTLSSSHPLHQILKYHCRDVTVPNTVGAPKLVGEGEFMDQLFAFGNEGTTRLLKEAHKLSTWDVTDFRNEIKVCDASVFPLNVSTYKNSKHFGQPKHFFRLKRHLNVFLLTTIFRLYIRMKNRQSTLFSNKRAKAEEKIELIFFHAVL